MEKVLLYFFLTLILLCHCLGKNFFPKIDIFGQMASTSIVHTQLADEVNLKYTLRHGLWWSFI